MTTMTYPVNGNLALKPVRRATPRLSVVEGGASSQVRASVVASVHRACAGVIIAVIVGMFAVCGWFTLDAPARAYAAALDTTELVDITVEAGDSLWTIAERHPVSGITTKDVTMLIKEWNGLDTGAVAPGDVLLVPAVNS